MSWPRPERAAAKAIAREIGNYLTNHDEKKDRVEARLESGKKIHGEVLLYTVGRQANTDLLNLAAAGIAAEARGRISVNEHYQTSVPHIYAAGDVIGFPSLAASSMEQGGSPEREYFRDTVFNYPTLAEAYKVAALDGLNKL